MLEARIHNGKEIIPGSKVTVTTLPLRRWGTKLVTDTKAKLHTEINQANLINIMISSNRNFLSEVRMSALYMSSFFQSGIQISVPTQTLINTSNPKGLSR